MTESMTLDFLSKEVNGFIEGVSSVAPGRVQVDTNLLEDGLLDSFALVQFVLFVERTLKIEIPIGDFMLESIASISSIYDHYVLGQPLLYAIAQL